LEKLNNYQVFPQEYFSGTDCYISFNNIPIEEIVTLEFAIQEPIIPIYGYASYVYDAVAHGGRIVRGSFTIAFKESFYIRSILDKLSDQGISSKNPKKPMSDMNEQQILAWIKGRNIAEIEEVANKYSEKLWNQSKAIEVNKQKDPFFSPSDSELSNYGFDIILSYGSELLEVGKEVKEFPGTVKFINGVHLMEVTQILQPSGEPVYEKYSFIAKDIDNTI